MSIFEEATKRKLRFDTASGTLSTEELWDLPLLSERSLCLDDVAKECYADVSDSQEPSFVKKAKVVNVEAQLRFDVVKHIIDVKLVQESEAKLAAAKKLKRQKIAELLEQKKDQQLADKSIEELNQMLNEL